MIERLICALFGHKYAVEWRMNPRTRKVGCARCDRHWAMHDPTCSFIPWDDEIEAMYAPGGELDPAQEPTPQPVAAIRGTT